MTLKNIFYDWHGYNTAIFYAINGIHADTYDKFMILGTMLGKYKLFPIYILLIIGYSCYDISKCKKISQTSEYLKRRESWKKTIAVLIFGFLANLLWVRSLKAYLAMPRPFVALPKGTVMQLWTETPYSSFPSGHCCFAMLMVAGLWPMLGKSGKIFAVFYLIWVALSRIVFGVHFPVDVVDSLLLSFIAVYLIRKIVYRVWPLAQYSIKVFLSKEK